MKPPRFRYVRPATLDEALATLAAHADDAKIIAGGQSLVPMMNFRLLAPTVLIDVNRLPDLDAIAAGESGGLTVGALTRHRALETSRPVADAFPVLRHAVTYIGHLAIRNRGTIGGSLSHADPTAELPLMSVLLDARLTVASARGERTIAAGEFFLGPLATALEPDEMLVRVEFPPVGGASGWAFEEFARRSGDYAIAAVGVVLAATDDRVDSVRIAVAGGGGGPVRVGAAEAILTGARFDEATLEAAVRALDAALDPTGDLQVSAEYRRHLIGVLARRAVQAAWRRAKEPGA